MSQSTTILKIFQIIIPFFFLISHSSNTFIVDNHKLVYTQCSKQTSSNPPLISNLFQEFITHSSKSTFFETLISDEKTAISGTFQCINNLTPDECRSCISKIPNTLSRNPCSKARIQLNGCYARYEEEDADGDGEETNSGPHQVLHGACSKRKIKRARFVEMKYEAFAALESGVMSGNGFCEMNYESIHVVAQCGGRVRSCDCGECVSIAARIAGEEECRYAVSGEVYLDNCFVGYDYRGGGFGTYKGGGGGSTKLVAIVVGSLAILGLGIGLCYFMRSCGKNKDDW